MRTESSRHAEEQNHCDRLTGGRAVGLDGGQGGGREHSFGAVFGMKYVYGEVLDAEIARIIAMGGADCGRSARAPSGESLRDPHPCDVPVALHTAQSERHVRQRSGLQVATFCGVDEVFGRTHEDGRLPDVLG